MCGIVFSLTSDTYALHADDWFRDALITSQVRGMHSTGMMQLDKKGLLSTYKQAQNASDFLEMTQARSLISSVPSSPLTVGHVRHATAGSVNDKNAHPFVITRMDGTKLAGVHNGTLRGWKDKEGGTEQEVDSAWAFQIMAEKGYHEAFRYFNGAFAFVWYDDLYPDHVFMTRNDERPLHYFLSEDKKTILGASELGMLGWLAERNQFKMDRKAGTQLFYLAPDKIYKFSLKDIGAVEVSDRPKYDPSTTLPKPAVTYPTQSMVPYKDARQYDDGGWDWDDDGLPWGAASVGVRQTSGYLSDQAKTLKAVKEALRAARNNHKEAPPTTDNVPVTDDRIITGELLDTRMEEGIKAAIENFQQKSIIDPWVLVAQDMFVGNPTDKSCTSEEIKAAKDARVYGKAVAFTGILWDDDTSDTWGEVDVVRNGQKITRDCIIRGATSSVAKARYIEAKEPVVLTVIGVMEGFDSKSDVWLLSELTVQSRKDLESRMMRKHAVH